MTDEVKVQYVDLDEMKFWPRNPKEHDNEHIMESMLRFGFTAPMIRDETSGQLVGGHGRVESLLALKDAGKKVKRIRIRKGKWFAPVITLPFKDVHEAEAYLLADNRLVENGGWNDALLGSILKDLRERDALAGIGWSSREVDNILRSVDEKERPEFAGKLPEDYLDDFLDAEIRQIVLFFGAKEYDEVVGKLNAIMEDKKLESHTDVFNLLMDHYLPAAPAEAS